MVTKQGSKSLSSLFCLILAKNHMVTKQARKSFSSVSCLILAKNHMVTKRCALIASTLDGSYSSKKSYGNKTSNTCYHIFKNNKILNIL